MANLFNMFETDPKLEAEGFWYDFDEDTSFLIARAGGANTNFLIAFEKATRSSRNVKKTKRQRQSSGVESFTENKEAMREAFAEAVILNWKGVTDRKGKEIPYSKENALKLLTDLPNLFQELLTVANEESFFKSEETEADLKN